MNGQMVGGMQGVDQLQMASFDALLLEPHPEGLGAQNGVNQGGLYTPSGEELARCIHILGEGGIAAQEPRMDHVLDPLSGGLIFDVRRPGVQL